MDIAEFQVIRSPRKISRLDSRFIFLETSQTGETRTAESSFGGMRMRMPVATRDGAETVSTASYDGGERREAIPIEDVLSVDGDSFRLVKLLSKLDQWLVSKEDRVSGKALYAYLISHFKEAGYDTIGEFNDTLEPGRAALVARLIEALHDDDPSLSNALLITRLLFIEHLLADDGTNLEELSVDDVWYALHMLTAVLPLEAFPVERRQPFVPLVRNATVADLAVVRKEWVCYLPGEIAAIRNVMAGESFSHVLRNVRETETVEETEEEERTQTQTEAEQETNTELSNEVNTQVKLGLRGYLDVKGEYKTPASTTNISAGVNGEVSYDTSIRHASQIAQRAVARATSNVDKRTREWRQQRELRRTEDQTKYSLKNETVSHMRGVYRWVDRIDRYQTFLYPDRLQLEFQLPEPATYYRARKANKQSQANLSAPPEFEVTLYEITPENILTLAQTYHASNFPTLPDRKVSMLVSKTFLPTEGGGPQTTPTEAASPGIGGDVEVLVPEGYAATRISITGQAFAAFGKWIDGGNSSPPRPFSINVVTTVGKELNSRKKPSTVFPAPWQQSTEYAVALTTQGQPTVIDLNPPVVGTAKLGVLAYGTSHAIISFNIECTRTAEAEFAWQLEVYDALFAAWKQWQEEWEAAQMSQAMISSLPSNEGGSQRNLLTVRDELKRQVISWLLQESPFEGRHGLGNQYRNTGRPDEEGIPWLDIDLTKARLDAPIIQFLEQAFDWGLISYIFYPYYWADASQWDELSEIQANDPDFERFLKAGSARVIVPARKNMEDSVHHYLITGQPFMSQQLPIPGDNMYISVAAEIHDLTQPPEDGRPGESWEVLSTTTLLILDDQQDLPRNSNTRLTAPKDPYCEDEDANTP